MRTGERDENASLRRQSILIALFCVVGDGAPFLLQAAGLPFHPAILAAGAAILLADLALALPARTALPVAVLHGAVRLGVALTLLAATGVHDNGIANSTGLVLAGYRAGAWLKGEQSWAALAALFLGMGITQWVQGFEETASNILLTATNTVLPWLMGRYTTRRSGYIEEIERRAEDERRTAAQSLALAVEAERVAIARDLHDTISHHVSAVGVHAAAARLGMAAGLPPGEGKVAGSLGQVEVSSRAALADLRRMLDLLHGADTDGVRQPGLAALDDLVEGSRRAGLTVRLQVVGLAPRELPDSLDLAAYRTIQEILTNALRHGDGELRLGVTQTATELLVTGTNTRASTRSSTSGTGRGLDGIRHRVALFGGSVTTGPPPEAPATWRTSLALPLQESV